ncbi:alpha/beta hydrolase family protein [Paenibacillus sp. IHBB 10380]|uniref:alpha/beta hydrolase family protein n=1 Tax=Paenibacillus sp. IHBB 10380 TaxID=1566358 RepID=UPI0005CFE7E2|nr:prolyl oligopeptidase family serine peptidase [Paenibacillus sp. IHBB 10380]AJS58836.1 peptidase S9 [Paenibacillus sp. IHBB 10380]
MMFHITYISEGLKVKGYLCLPHGYKIPVSDLQTCIESFYPSVELPITQLASSIEPDKQDIKKHKWPVLMYCRGGIGRVGSVKTQWLEQFANYGHIIFAPSYRGTEGGEGRDEFGGQDKEDVLSAYRLISSLPFVDPDRISVMGFSRGAINATQTVTDITQVNTCILWSGVSDLAQTYEERVDLRKMLKRVIGGSPMKVPDSYHARSPIAMAEQIRCPILIIHGTQDTQVDYSQGLQMANKLQEVGANVTLHKYEGLGHHFPLAIHKVAIERMFEWINRSST